MSIWRNYYHYYESEALCRVRRKKTLSFVSLEHKGYSKNSSQLLYTVLDSEYGELDVDAIALRIIGSDYLSETIIVKAYIDRNLSVGRNLALATIYMTDKRRPFSIEQIMKIQDKYCPKHIPNWEQYAKERDHHLEKLLALV